MGLKQLKKINKIIKSRNKIRQRYIKELCDTNFIPQKIDENVYFNNQSIVFRMQNNKLRNQLIKFLKKNNIETTIGYYSLSNTTYYKKKYNSQMLNSKILQDTTIALPCYDQLKVDKVINKINFLINNK
jgi:perosamine synthetase